MYSLSDPLQIGKLILRNRIVMPPMYTGLATFEGAVTENLIRHYVQRASKVGLIIIEHSYVISGGKLSERQLGIHTDELVLGLERLSSLVHAAATPVVIQINHAGRAANAKITGLTPVGPSQEDEVKELSHEEIEKLVDAFAAAAERAMRAGFDGVEIHGAHGFLLNQFFSPITNRRTDKYGGSLENRMRFPLEVVRKVKEKVGGRLLLYRIGSDDLDPKGTQIDDSKRLASLLVSHGVNVIDVSGGLCGSRPKQLEDKQGYFVPQAEEIKNVVNVPVIGVGGITDITYANSLISEGSIDLVAIGRSLFEDPNWPEKDRKVLN